MNGISDRSRNLRVTEVSIRSFRGVPRDLRLDFRPSPGAQPASLLLAGDNGTGKSSVVDALEFALQARIGRRRSLNKLGAPALRSFAVSEAPVVSAGLSDGTTVLRPLEMDDDGRLFLTERTPHEAFSAFPFVLRRADLLRFLEAPDQQRQVIFFDYFLGSRPTQTSPEEVVQEDDDLEEIKIERIEVKKRRRELVAELARRLHIDVEAIPLGTAEFDRFAHQSIYRGLSPSKARKRGITLRLPDGVPELVKEVSRANRAVESANNRLRHYEQLQAAQPAKAGARLEAMLLNASERLSDAFLRISGTKFVESLELELGAITEVSLTLRVRLRDGQLVPITSVLSEANLDLLALLVFLVIAKTASEEEGQARFLVLDDVLQSIDATIRVAVVDYLLTEFKTWQLMLTVHDRLWREQLKALFQRHGHQLVEKEIVRWTFDEGPVIRDAQQTAADSLRRALEYADRTMICAQAGVLLEAICDHLSWTLETSVVRKQGDRYTLGDLWPGVRKALRKLGAGAEVDAADMWIHLRNLAGAHYNEWAAALSEYEADQFGSAVLELFAAVHCAKCLTWVAGRDGTYACRCGETTLETGRSPSSLSN
jgi:recombinational DNA repair ATPase RecF